MEAPYYGVPTIDIGSRQKNRAKIQSIFNQNNFTKISKLISKYKEKKYNLKPLQYFGSGNSNKMFLSILKQKRVWKIKNQKQFVQLDLNKKIFKN